MQMDPVRKKALGRSMPKRGKANRMTRTDSLLRRQSQSITASFSKIHSEIFIMIFTTGDKTWLETHIWHAKRMKMVTKYGYRLV